MKVSIITACFNREKTIRETIESVLSQDYSDIEYIIIDGASTDKTLDVINGYESKVSIIISEPDNGMYEGINKGIKKATGDIIGLLHSDDFFYSPYTVSHIVSEFYKTNTDIVYGNGLFVNKQDTNKIIRNWISGKFDRKKVAKGWLPLHPTVYIKKECFAKAGYYNENFKIAADSDFLVRYLYKENFKVSYLNEYFIKMRMGGASTTLNKTIQKWKEDLRMYRSHGFNSYITLFFKILSKIPQFIKTKIK